MGPLTWWFIRSRGVYEIEEGFDVEWNMTPDKEGLVNFISLDLWTPGSWLTR